MPYPNTTTSFHNGNTPSDWQEQAYRVPRRLRYADPDPEPDDEADPDTDDKVLRVERDGQ